MNTPIKNATFDSLAIAAISIGITLVQTDLLKGMCLLGTGIALTLIKYFTR